MHVANLLVTFVESSDFGYCIVTGQELDLRCLPYIIGSVQRDGLRH